MDKVSNISFKGIINVGVINIAKPKIGTTRMIAQLNNNKTPHLERLEDVFRMYPDPLGGNYIRIDNEYITTGQSKLIGQFRVNGKYFPVSYKNFPMTAKILALLDEIGDLALEYRVNEEYLRPPVEDLYLGSKDCLINLGINEMEPIPSAPQVNRIIRNAHQASAVESVTENLAKALLKMFAESTE